MMRPLILVSNDDGIEAKGVSELVKCLNEYGDVVVVCPAGPQSAKSMALTVSEPLRIEKVDDFHGAEAYKVNGTPVDCVKLAMHTVLKGRRPSLVVSGINHGSNAAINVIYSGTMGAAMEGCAFGIPSVGLSLTDHSHDADFTPVMPFVKEIVEKTLEYGLPEGICLNVNFPNDIKEIKGMRIARACKGNWTDEYKEYTDPAGKKFYMLCGRFENEEPDATDTDEWCLHHEIASVVPTALDRTAPVSPAWLENLR